MSTKEMLIRKHISTAKRLFQRALQSFKSYLSKTEDEQVSYQKLAPFKVSTHENESSSSYRRSKMSVQKRNNKSAHHRRHQEEEELSKRKVRMKMVAKSLKEMMEMVDNTNMDHLLDIQEAFHYYSRLTSPTYLDMVDRFFMELQVEFLGMAPTT